MGVPVLRPGGKGPIPAHAASTPHVPIGGGGLCSNSPARLGAVHAAISRPSPIIVRIMN
jgi:hypothetical protein